jgi:hypothetical protein|tara:strand:- start:134 stop:370 length:237 start_codon:yes stop_codon:yes gene_type:complete
MNNIKILYSHFEISEIAVVVERRLLHAQERLQVLNRLKIDRIDKDNSGAVPYDVEIEKENDIIDRLQQVLQILNVESA